jgi:hypothetical protein
MRDREVVTPSQLAEFSKHTLNDDLNCIDFVFCAQIRTEDANEQYSVGRFQGDPNETKDLQNMIIPDNYVWYFSIKDQGSNKIG